MFSGVSHYKGKNLINSLNDFLPKFVFKNKVLTLHLCLITMHEYFPYNFSTLNMKADVDTVMGFFDIPPYVTMVPRCLKP